MVEEGSAAERGEEGQEAERGEEGQEAEKLRREQQPGGELRPPAKEPPVKTRGSPGQGHGRFTVKSRDPARLVELSVCAPSQRCLSVLTTAPHFEPGSSALR